MRLVGGVMKSVNISLCPCGKYLEKVEWKPYTDIDDLILKKIRLELPKAKVSIKNIELPEKLKEKKEYHLVAKTKDDDYDVTVSLKLARCNLCSREGTQYFEATLQLRSANAALLEESVQFLQTRVHNLRSRGMFINKAERFEDGFDLYMTSRKITQALSKELQEHFGGIMKVSPRLFTRNKQTSKNVFRVNIYVELPGFSRGDIILVDDKVCFVEKIGKKIKLIDLQNDSSMVIDYEKMDYALMKKQQTYVSRTYPSLEVINPLDFQSSMVKNKPKQTFTNGQMINVVIHKGIYVVD
ncbi:MAG: NMD3-related protein [archaeon]